MRGNEHHPFGLYLGIKYAPGSYSGRFRDSEEVWKIDVWFIKREDSQAFEYTKNLKEKLDPEKIKAILEIKNEIWKSPRYKREIFSTDIYDAVLDNGVKNLEEFEKFLKKIGKQI